MNTGRTFLVALDALHAEVLDGLVFARLQDVEQCSGNSWSGVWTDGERFAIVWANPVSSLFGVPDDFPELVLAEEVVGEEWTLVVPEPNENERA